MKLPVWKPLYLAMKLFGLPVEWEKSVGAVLFRERDGAREYLLLRYPSGHYEFPRGHVEAGETEEDTLRREVNEETGISDIVRIYPLRLENQFYYTAGAQESARRAREGRGRLVFKRTFLYPAKASGAETRLSHEHTDYVWLPYGAALERITFENARHVLRMTEEMLAQEDSSDRNVVDDENIRV